MVVATWQGARMPGYGGYVAAPTKDELLEAIRRLPLDERLQLIRQREADEETSKPAPAGASPESSGLGRRLTVDELLAARLTPPPGVGPVSLGDIERAIKPG
jgi:hypothetical protein